MKIVVNCVSDLPDVVNTLSDFIHKSKVVCFYGEMGVGKTTLIKEICKVLGVRDIVTSPTFSIVNQYIASSGVDIYHFDFYRIDTVEEALNIGYEEYFYGNNLCFVEWPEKVEPIIPKDVLSIYIAKNNNKRIIEISEL